MREKQFTEFQIKYAESQPKFSYHIEGAWDADGKRVEHYLFGYAPKYYPSCYHSVTLTKHFGHKKLTKTSTLKMQLTVIPAVTTRMLSFYSTINPLRWRKVI